MRYHHLRFDIWICLLFSFLIGSLVSLVVESLVLKSYDSYVLKHTVDDGNIGGKASDKIVRVNSIEDMLKHEVFTIVSPGIEYRNRGAGYFDSYYMYSVTLPSGERVAARINMEAVQNTGDSIYSSDSILPVGKIIYKDLSKSKSFLSQIEYSEPLTRKDFYVDMIGNGGKLSKDDYVEVPKLVSLFITIVILFPIFHTIGSRLGIFPYFFAPRIKTKSEWE